MLAYVQTVEIFCTLACAMVTCLDAVYLDVADFGMMKTLVNIFVDNNPFLNSLPLSLKSRTNEVKIGLNRCVKIYNIYILFWDHLYVQCIGYSAGSLFYARTQYHEITCQRQ